LYPGSPVILEPLFLRNCPLSTCIYEDWSFPNTLVNGEYKRERERERKTELREKKEAKNRVKKEE